MLLTTSATSPAAEPVSDMLSAMRSTMTPVLFKLRAVAFWYSEPQLKPNLGGRQVED